MQSIWYKIIAHLLLINGSGWSKRPKKLSCSSEVSYKLLWGEEGWGLKGHTLSGQDPDFLLPFQQASSHLSSLWTEVPRQISFGKSSIPSTDLKIIVIWKPLNHMIAMIHPSSKINIYSNYLLKLRKRKKSEGKPLTPLDNTVVQAKCCILGSSQWTHAAGLWTRTHEPHSADDERKPRKTQ